MRLIDLDGALCPGGVCTAVVNGTVMYRDTHHLTQTYITSLEPFFMRKLLATRAVRTAHFRSGTGCESAALAKVSAPCSSGPK